MTSHLRAELLDALAWTTHHGGAPDCQVIAEAYGRRLLRAPGWAAAEIGWPGATRASGYLQRIVATPVTSAQAHAAVSAVARADAEAAALRTPAASLPGPPRAVADAQRHELHQAGPRAVLPGPSGRTDAPA
jgi:hypothetical protein